MPTQPEEETYSIMFSSLRHPARRKILRMLSQKPMTFSQMQESLGIVSSHLTYHLESLGELVSKMDDGKYRLSSFGEAAIATMNNVEEAPSIPSGRLRLSLRWKTVFAGLLIAVILLASLSAVTYTSLNQLAQDQETLRAELQETQAQNQQLLAWSTSADKAVTVLRDVIQLDLEKYTASLISHTIERRVDLGGVTEEILKYSLTGSDSRFDVVLRFRDQHFSRYQLYIDEGTPSFTQPQATLLDAAKNLVERYLAYSGDSYLEDMNSLLASVNKTDNAQAISGNLKLKITTSGNDAVIEWGYTENGFDYAGKGLRLVYENRVLKEMTDGYFLLEIGSTQVNYSQEQAIEIAREAAQNYTLRIDGAQVENFTVLQQPAEVDFAPHPRDIPLELIPYWYIVLPLDQTYADGTNAISVGLWADTGKVANIQPTISLDS